MVGDDFSGLVPNCPAVADLFAFTVNYFSTFEGSWYVTFYSANYFDTCPNGTHEVSF